MTDRTLLIGNYKTHDDGVRSCIYWEGRKKLHLMTLDPPLRVRAVPMSEAKHITPLTRKGSPYPLNRFLKFYKRAGKAFGKTESAKKILKAATEQVAASR